MTATTTYSTAPMLEPLALDATRAAALACAEWVGRRDAHAADAAATEAMRAVLAGGRGTGTVIVGEGAKDQAPMLFVGECLGTGEGPEFDIAVDPLEGTKLCANGLPGALSTIAFAPAGSMAALADSYYMDKIVGSPELADLLDFRAGPLANVRAVSAALGRSARVIVLDKPRHQALIGALDTAGAELRTPSDGDVAGALSALLQDGWADMLLGIGGTPEGVLTACAVRALGGFMQARLAPQLPEEREAIARAGLDTTRIYDAAELSGDGLFVACGVTGGQLLAGPERAGRLIRTESIVIAAGAVQRIRMEGRA